MPEYLIGIDIGGTFTDIVIYNTENSEINVIKVPSTSREPENAVIEALKNLGIDKDGIRIINHSTTIATNALLTRSGLPKAALITNRGFRDILEIGRQRRAEIYNLDFQRPEPLIPRKYRFGIRGRIDAFGKEIEKINKEELKKIKSIIKNEEIETIAVTLLNSYLNPSHEISVREFLNDTCRNIHISSQIDPQYREYERTSTTVVNAVLSPIISGYIENLRANIQNIGISAPLYIMSSNGGLNTPEYVTKTPISIIESGPSAGVIAASFLAKNIGREKIITFDMGGTTAKAGTIIGGKPDIVYEFEAAGKTHSGRSIKGSGYPVRYPFIDLAEVSAGGGTVAWMDEAKMLRVGPKSAGSDPGPAAYGKGGSDPTVTDANIILGRLNQEYLLGGSMRIYPELARAAMHEKLGVRMNLGVEEIAMGILKIINNSMAKAISIVSIERGRDPRDFSMIAFGGAGPMHACDLAEEMKINELIIPEHPGLFSAYGLISVDITRTFVEQVFNRNLDDVFSSLIEKAKGSMELEGLTNIIFERYIDVRYRGQSFEITLKYENGMNIKEIFDMEHERIYGFSSQDPVEIVNAKVNAMAKVQKMNLRKINEKRSPEKTVRMVYYSDSFIPMDVIKRETLYPGFSGKGPAIIEGYDSTIVVNRNWTYEVDEYLNVILRR